MLWYKDKKKWLQRINQPLSFIEYIAYGLVLAVIGFIIGYGYQSVVNVIGRHCVW